MAFLEINGKEFEAKCTFRFERLADKKYSEKDNDGNDVGGFHGLYTNLLQYSNKHLLAFWDCGLEYLGKDKPKLEDIEAAIEQRIEEDGDTEKLFKEAFNAVDESGFFKKQAKSYWKNIEAYKKTGKTEEEKAEREQQTEMLFQMRKEMKE
ncbi:hypothetical protein J7E38_13650 [Bacillus sp. ISL-35]|uniref:tail assembly chaperone n=1 Tax=Bacillus sp. ISL-35 TaxID=2819122 RepID=UPI001BEABC5C|nr:tail assembly chaperone [Bacillus sp. ISL-35]MBT2680054.1 hypothetical protein [Bacillus sp. ISL-35]MBT2702969.1 hypothetical protein [Chryseobacterium sp. ISL-80]